MIIVRVILIISPINLNMPPVTLLFHDGGIDLDGIIVVDVVRNDEADKRIFGIFRQCRTNFNCELC